MGEMGATGGTLWLLATGRLERCVSSVAGGCSGRSEERMVGGRVGVGIGERMSC
jgi:hypothetical protein